MQDLLLKYLRKFPLDYGKSILAKRIQLPKESTLYTNSLGVKFMLDMDEYQMRNIYLYDIYERNTYKNLERILKEDDVFIDVGANVGFYALNISTLLPKGEIHSFEPNPYVLKYYLQNYKLNNPGNIRINKFGLSDSSKIVKIFFDSDNTGAGSIFRKDGKEVFDIELKKFDEYYNDNNLKKINVIKVDIEGSELDFLKGAEYAIKQNKKLVVIIEMMQENFVKAGYKSQDITEFLFSRGFKAYLPKPFPYRLKKIETISETYMDNIFFIRS